MRGRRNVETNVGELADSPNFRWSRFTAQCTGYCAQRCSHEKDENRREMGSLSATERDDGREEGERCPGRAVMGSDGDEE